MCASPRKAVAAMHQATRSSPAGMYNAERTAAGQQQHQNENREQKKSRKPAGQQIQAIENQTHGGLPAAA